MAKTWILTASVDNFRATRDHEFSLIGAKEKRRAMAEQIEPGDRIVFYLTGIQAFGGIVRVTGEMYEDRTKVWPGKPGKADPYPWRFATEPVAASEVLEAFAKEYAGMEPAYKLPPRMVANSLRLKPMRAAFGGAPRESIQYLNHPVTFDTRTAQDTLGPLGVRCPPFDEYVGRLVKFFREHEDDESFVPA